MTARNQLNRYGSQGTLKIPQDNGVYDPTTGDTTVVYDDYDILYVPYPVASEDLGAFGLSAFDGSFVTFMFKNQDTSGLVIPTTSFIQTLTERIDIQEMQYVKVQDKILLYQAKSKVAA